MSFHYRVILLIGAIILAALAACNRPAATPTVQPEAGLLHTAAAQTVEAELTIAASSPRPTFTPMPPPATATNTPAPQPIPTITPATSPAATDENSDARCNQARFVEDVTIPDGTELDPGEGFVKTWRLQNTGTCSWDSGYSVVFTDGDALGGPAAQNLTSNTVPPNGEVEISIEMTAPEEPGSYRGNWSLRSPGGEVFGLGESGRERFWVDIVIRGPTPEPDPDFSLGFDSVHTCDGRLSLIFQVENLGNIEFESAQITIINPGDNSKVYGPETENRFILDEPEDCPPGKESLRLGKLKYLAAIPGILPSSGTPLRVQIKLCSRQDLVGVCLEKTADFNSP